MILKDKDNCQKGRRLLTIIKKRLLKVSVPFDNWKRGKMKKNKKQKTQNKLERMLEIPKELSSTEPKITIMGFNEVLIENYKGILEYQEFYIRISTYIGIININGFNLNLTEMTSDDIMITGKIENIDFEELC